MPEERICVIRLTGRASPARTSDSDHTLVVPPRTMSFAYPMCELSDGGTEYFLISAQSTYLINPLVVLYRGAVVALCLYRLNSRKISIHAELQLGSHGDGDPISLRIRIRQTHQLQEARVVAQPTDVLPSDAVYDATLSVEDGRGFLIALSP